MRISNDHLTLLKLLAVISMVIDHFNKFANPEYSQSMFALGRLALPLFVFVLAFNLARIEATKMPAIAGRLVFFGILAIVPYNAMDGAIFAGWWPLNVLFMLAGLVGVVYLLIVPVSRPWARHACHFGAVLLFLVVGAIAEFFWVGIGLGLVAWRAFRLFSRRETKQGRVLGEGVLLILAAAVCFVLLNLINGNAWALAALPLILVLLLLPCPKLPRLKWFFYWFYPAHLWALWLIGI